MSIAQPRKTTYIHTHIIMGKRSCTIKVAAELLMTGWLCPPNPYMESAPLDIARKTSASKVRYSQEALHQMLYKYLHTYTDVVIHSRIYNKIAYFSLLCRHG